MSSCKFADPRLTLRCFAPPCPQPCPLPIYFLLPLTFHSSHACLLSEDRPLHGSPPHVQCDQYKGQGPCTRTPSLTKREGLEARGSARPSHVPACARFGERACARSRPRLSTQAVRLCPRVPETGRSMLKLGNKWRGNLRWMERLSPQFVTPVCVTAKGP